MSKDADLFNVGIKNEPAMRNDKGKIRYDLLPFDALSEVALVYTKGAEKYADRNWELGMSWSRMFRSLLSHLFKWWSGRTYDDELKTRHMAMVVWNALGLLTYEIRKVGTDDRPLGGNTETSISGEASAADTLHLRENNYKWDVVWV